jgi:hypothetical protein
MLECSFIVWDAHIGWPGSSGDSTIWKSRPFYDDFGTPASFLQEDDYFLGDQGCVYLLYTALCP